MFGVSDLFKSVEQNEQNNNQEIVGSIVETNSTIQNNTQSVVSAGDGIRRNDGEGGGRNTEQRSSEYKGSTGILGRAWGIGDLLRNKFQSMAPEQRLKFISQRLSGGIQQSSRNSYYHSAVFRCEIVDNLEGLIAEITKKNRNAAYKWLTRHDDHYHFVHDCAWSNRQCRCYDFKFDVKPRRVVRSKDLNEEDCEFIINYHFKAGRRIIYLEIGGRRFDGLFVGNENIRHEDDPTGENRDSGHVEICDSEIEVLWNKIMGPQDIPIEREVNRGGVADGNQAKKRARRSTTSTENVQEKLEKFIFKIGKVPLHDFVTTEEFYKSEWRFMNPMSTSFKNAISTVKMQYYGWKLRDYKNYYENLQELPYWDTNTREEFHDKYLSITESKAIITKLLIWQYHNESICSSTFEIINDEWKTDVYDYVKDLILLLDKKRNKLNTDCYVSSPNAGKTLFLDMIRDFLISCGQMLNWNRSSQFPMQTCGFARCIFWNEPNFESSVESSLLKLLGGDSLNAAIKNQMDVNITKTPILVSSNSYPFPKTPEFNYRIKLHKWKSAPFLIKTKGKKIHPLTFLYIINQCQNYYQEDLIEYELKYKNSEESEHYLLLSDLKNLYDVFNETDNYNADNE